MDAHILLDLGPLWIGELFRILSGTQEFVPNDQMLSQKRHFSSFA